MTAQPHVRAHGSRRRADERWDRSSTGSAASGSRRRADDGTGRATEQRLRTIDSTQHATDQHRHTTNGRGHRNGGIEHSTGQRRRTIDRRTPASARIGPARRRKGARSHRGTLTVEFALLVPALVLLLGLITGGARTWLARTTVEQMAGAAARAASLERTPAAARTAAHELASAQAAVGGLRCLDLTVTVDSSALALPSGTPGTVTATVRCDVPLADVLVPWWPGSLAVSASASAVADTYRERQ